MGEAGEGRCVATISHSCSFLGSSYFFPTLYIYLFFVVVCLFLFVCLFFFFSKYTIQCRSLLLLLLLMVEIFARVLFVDMRLSSPIV